MINKQVDIIDFIIDSKYEDFDLYLINQAKLCLLDALAVSLIGSKTKLSEIVNNFAKEFYKGDDSFSLVHKSMMSQLGALFVSTMSIDAFDMHDGHVLTKGHTGVSIIPASLIIHNNKKISGKDVLTNIIIGYEVSLRAGMALHNSVSDYHTSGAWNALGVCAIACRILNLSKEQVKHALGICEFYAPRSQMMKVIDFPTMLKDGSGFGAFVGLKATLLAKTGFTGAPSLIFFSEKTKVHWEDLGKKFHITKQYFKPYPVCRWTQPSIEAAKALCENYIFEIEDIEELIIETFHEATRLNNNIPNDTEEAQYALKYPTVLSLIRKDLVKLMVVENFDLDEKTMSLFNKTKVVEKQNFNEAFPKKRFANLILKMKNGEVYDSGKKEAIWGEDNPPSYEEIKQKFYSLNKEIYGTSFLTQIEKMVFTLDNIDDITTLNKII